jgi:hypothetical protein
MIAARKKFRSLFSGGHSTAPKPTSIGFVRSKLFSPSVDSSSSRRSARRQLASANARFFILESRGGVEGHARIDERGHRPIRGPGERSATILGYGTMLRAYTGGRARSRSRFRVLPARLSIPISPPKNDPRDRAEALGRFSGTSRFPFHVTQSITGRFTDVKKSFAGANHV